MRTKSIMCLGIAAAVLAGGVSCSHPTSKPAVRCFVGGTMAPAVRKLAEKYQQQTGQEIQLDEGDSGQLLVRIETQEKADLYICHDPFMDMLMAKGLGRDAWTIAAMTPVIVVPKGNPKGIARLEDLARPDVSLILTDYDYSTLGHLLPIMFKKAGVDFEKLKANNVKETVRSGSNAANIVELGRYDAAIVWDAVAYLRKDKLDTIPIEKSHLPQSGIDAVTSATGKSYDPGRVRVTVSTLKGGSNPEQARAFAEFLASPAAAETFAEFGYTTTRPTMEYKDGQAVNKVTP